MSSIELTSHGGVPTEEDMGGRQVAEEFALLAIFAILRGHQVSTEDITQAREIITKEIVEESQLLA